MKTERAIQADLVQPDLFRTPIENHEPCPGPDFDGPDYDPAQDKARLTGQILKIYNVMKDGRRRSLARIAEITGYPESSISAQLRHLRKPKFGSHDVRKTRTMEGAGTWVYWIND